MLCNAPAVALFLTVIEGSTAANYVALNKCRKSMRYTMHRLQKINFKPACGDMPLTIVTHCHLQITNLINRKHIKTDVSMAVISL